MTDRDDVIRALKVPYLIGRALAARGDDIRHLPLGGTGLTESEIREFHAGLNEGRYQLSLETPPIDFVKLQAEIDARQRRSDRSR